MKNQNIVLIAIASALAFALAPVTQAAPTPEDLALPVITIHSAGNVLRGKTGSFVLKMSPPLMFGGMHVNFKVSGTAIPGVDYVALVSPAYIGASGYGVISLKTLPNPRGPSNNQAYSVVVTLEAGPGYALGEPKSALIWISQNIVATPVITPGDGFSTTSHLHTANIQTTTTSAWISYTLDGSAPSRTHGTIVQYYGTNVSVTIPSGGVTIAAMGFQSGWTDSQITWANWTYGNMKK